MKYRFRNYLGTVRATDQETVAVEKIVSWSQSPRGDDKPEGRGPQGQAVPSRGSGCSWAAGGKQRLGEREQEAEGPGN